MRLEFTKMQGCGNDYIYLDCLAGMPENVPDLARKLCPRRFSVGADGVICICKSDVAQARMRMFNADGSEGKMCGNGIRCVAQWLYERGLAGDQMQLETQAGIKTLRRTAPGCWQVDMGKADFRPQAVQAQGLGDQELVNLPLQVAGQRWQVSCLSMGNPHCVTFVEQPQQLDLERIGPQFEHHPAFLQGVNTEFVQVIGPSTLNMRVWERGSGETLACGTGACAVAAAAVRLGICQPDTQIEVKLPGGSLWIVVGADYQVSMTGPAQTVYTGLVSWHEEQ